MRVATDLVVEFEAGTHGRVRASNVGAISAPAIELRQGEDIVWIPANEFKEFLNAIQEWVQANGQ